MAEQTSRDATMTMETAIEIVIKQAIQTGDHKQGVEDIMNIFKDVMIKLMGE